MLSSLQGCKRAGKQENIENIEVPQRRHGQPKNIGLQEEENIQLEDPIQTGQEPPVDHKPSTPKL